MFKLLRFFSFASAAVMILAIVVLVLVFRQHEINSMIDTAEKNNVALARSFANTIWPVFAPYLKSVSNLDGAALRARPETNEIYKELKKITAGLPVLKVKIYSPDGIVLFSSSFSQIGDDKSQNPGLISAARDEIPASKLTFRDTFSAFEGKVMDRNLIASYLPIRPPGRPLEGVFELYTDVSHLVVKIDKATTKLVLGLLFFFSLLYGILFLIVRKADGILKRQHVELEETQDRLEMQVEERTKELSIRVKEARMANRSKTDFIANMSHELRTPLNAILGFSGVMKSKKFGELDEKYVEYIDDIIDSGEYLLGLINDILEFSALDKGKLELHEENLDIAKIIEASVHMIRERAADNNIKLNIDVPESLPMIYADRRQLMQIFLNLLTNAIKFTPSEGEVSLSASLNGESSFLFNVTDNGIGMDKEEIKIAMKRFEQIDSGLNRKQEGSGLGLPLIQGLIDLHGGTIKLDSEKGKGTEITVCFPPERTLECDRIRLNHFVST